MGLGVTIGAGLVPDADLTERAAEVVVTQRLGQPATFAIAFTLDIADSDWPLLADPRLGAGAEIMIAGDEGTECLVYGVVHAQRIRMVTGGESSSLEVIGGDHAIMLDRETKIATWPQMTDGEAAVAIMTAANLLPDAESTPARHLTNQNALLQRGTDLAFLNVLARRNGFLFWITSDVLGIRTGHFKRPPVTGTPARSLSLKDSASALASLDIEWNVERPTSAVARGLDVASKSPLSGEAAQTPLPAMGALPLAMIATEPRVAMPAVAGNDTGGLGARAEATLVENGFFITARCQTTHEAAGGLIHAHMLVEIDGAGTLHSGSYLVSEAIHRIGPRAHVMDLTLIRNAWG
ncbi:MAG: phage late control D family protein [Pararhodobacter sp.]